MVIFQKKNSMPWLDVAVKKSGVSQTYMQMERWYMVLFVPKVVFLIGILK